MWSYEGAGCTKPEINSKMARLRVTTVRQMSLDYPCRVMGAFSGWLMRWLLTSVRPTFVVGVPNIGSERFQLIEARHPEVALGRASNFDLEPSAPFAGYGHRLQSLLSVPIGDDELGARACELVNTVRENSGRVCVSLR